MGSRGSTRRSRLSRLERVVAKARTIADQGDIAVEGLLAAMSWETTQYKGISPRHRPLGKKHY